MRHRTVSFVGFLRVLGLGAALCLIAGVCLAQAAKRESLGALSKLGRDLLTWEEFRPHSKPRRLHLGPLSFGVLALSHPGEVAEVLDRFQEDCRERSVLVGPGDVPYYLDFREDRGDEGIVACLDLGKLKTPSEVLARLSELPSSDDLTGLAKAHYVFARKSGSQTTLVVVWNEGPFRLNDLANLAGLATSEAQTPATEARSPSPIKHPEEMREMFTAFEEGQGYAMSLHKSASAQPQIRIDSLLGHYRRELELAGYQLEKGARASHAGEEMLVGRRENSGVRIQLKRSQDGSLRVLSLFY